MTEALREDLGVVHHRQYVFRFARPSRLRLFYEHHPYNIFRQGKLW
jgi:hypothetical protein